MLAEKRKDTYRILILGKEPVTGKRAQAEPIGPVMIMHIRIMRHIIRDKGGHLTGSDTSDLVTPERNPPVNLAVNVSVAP